MIGNGIVTGARLDDVCAATAVDRITAGTTGNDIDPCRASDRRAGRQCRRVNIFKVCDDSPIAHSLVGKPKIDRSRGLEDKSVRSSAAVDGIFGPVVRD